MTNVYETPQADLDSNTEKRALTLAEIYLSFDGRINRSTYWLKYVLPVVALSIVVMIIDGLIGTNGILLLIYQVALIYPAIAVTAKRWHDRDKSGWWILINFVPLIGGIWAFIENGCLRGTEGNNRFGPEQE